MDPDAKDPSESPDSSSDEDSGTMADDRTDGRSTEGKSTSKSSNNTKSTTKSNAKDPLRPRRKKARRACFACQRAHLTCGDERPCMRCVKRGLQDQCHDGVRKKAKYLHDAPPEALMPGYASGYHGNGTHSLPNVSGATILDQNGMPVSQPSAYFSSSQTTSYPNYSSLPQQGQMGAPMIDSTTVIGDQPTFGSPVQFQQTAGQQISPVQDMSATIGSSTLDGVGNGSFDASFVDPSDPSLFNFNISDMNFGNHYGALEFGYMGHMTSGAVNTPDLDIMRSIDQNRNASYDSQAGYMSNLGYGDQAHSWQNATDAGSRQGSTNAFWNTQGNGVDAFAVGENATSQPGTSPHSQNQDFHGGYQSHTLSPENQFVQPDHPQQAEPVRHPTSQPTQRSRKPAPFPSDMNQFGFKKRRRDASEIYASVTKPHNYTQGFHNLFALLNSRYSGANVAEIAKALASIRPSFIASNKDLDNDDLTFMEKAFQRALYELDNHLSATGTLSLSCRRTGEVATVNKEYTLVTGWRRDVLVGKEPNLNVNIASSKSGSQTGGSNTRGTATPRISSAETSPGHPKAVSIAELMDEDSIVQFYKDFSELAFGAPRSSVVRRVHLTKYKTKDDPGWRSNDRIGADPSRETHDVIKREPLIKGEAGMKALGDGTGGRVECMCTWTIKRDTFDNPSIIIMNFLPIIS